MLKYAIIGFGGLGKVHFNGTEELNSIHNDVKLVAICDVNKDAFVSKTSTNLGEDKTELDLSKYNLYPDAKEMLEKEELDFIITAVPTYLHDDIAIMAMEKGTHVFSEKPMALSVERAQSMIDCAKKNNVKLMIGQCLRYSARYNKLKEIIDSGVYGKVIRASFHRISCTPIWGWENWFTDAEKSGGALLDLHVHDVDYINYAFGMPKSVTSMTTSYKTGLDSVVTMYGYDDKVVTCVGEWGCPAEYGFSSGFFVRMEKATIEVRNGKLMLFTEDGVNEEIVVDKKSDYVNEVADFVNTIKNDSVSEINPPEESLNAIRIALAERESAHRGQTVIL